MQLAVLASPDSFYFADLKRAAGQRHRVAALSYKQLAARFRGDALHINSGKTSLNSVDAVLVRSMPPGSLEQVVFRMDGLACLESAGVLVVNPAKAVETAVDKYLATARLQSAGLSVPPTVVCQTSAEAMIAYDQLGGDVVVKPLFGGEGRGMMRISDEAVARRAFTALEQVSAVLYVQQFILHDGRDWRLLVIGDDVLGMLRINRGDWRTNISLGGKAEPLEVSADVAAMARRAAGAIGASVAGVDLLPARDGRLYALEVNAVPGWKALAGATGVDVAAMVIRHLEKRLG